MRHSWFSLWTLLSLVLNLIAPLGVSAAPAVSAMDTPAREVNLLPTWFAPAPAPRSTEHEILPAWFDAPQAHVARSTEYGILPAWFSAPLPAPDYRLPANDYPLPADHHTIYDITVIGPSAPINNCDVVTFTLVAANDAVTTTGVIITSTMPAGFAPTQIVFNVGTVGPNQVITRYAVFSATCSAVSGQNVVTLTQSGYIPIVRYTDFVVNPGAITVRKEPAVIPAAPSDVVTWTVYVENTGYGTVSNVRVTDTLGSGLQYVSGLTSTYFISIPVGGVVTFPIAARVVGCSGLENVVTATWGCDGQQCLTPQTARGAVDLAMINPDLDFSLPTFDIPYCAGSGVFTIPIRNNGDGTAYSGTLAVDLSDFNVTVTPPASYDGSRFRLPDIPPGGTYYLVFTLTLPSTLCTMPRSGAFNFNLEYYDRCGHRYTELPQSVSWQLVNAPGQLSVSKSMPAEVYRGQTVTATVTVNADGIVGTIVVTDQVPAGWSVVDADGGTIQGNLIIWVLTGTTTLNPVFATPDATTGCDYCGLPATNIITATARDCQNCLQTATAQATTYLQCEEPVASTNKQVSGPAEVCSDPAFTYTNTYIFANTFHVTPTWQGMVFTEALPYQTYVTGSASAWMSNGVLSCSAVFSANVLGGMLVISNISPTCAITVPGSTMWISYRTAVSEPAACSDFEWYDWSYLNLGVTGNAECAADGVIEEGVFVRTLAPAMNLSLSGLPPWVSSCGVYTVTLTAQRTSAVPAYNAVLDVPTSTFAVIEVLGFSGATPAYTMTDSPGYHWYYSDTFATATTGTVQLRVQLRCGSGTAPFRGTLRYDNHCGSQCSTGGILSAPPVIGPLPILTKFPEVIYAHGDIVTWTLIAYNSGAGPAYSVVLTDALGSGLRYVNSSITSTQGSVVGVTPITSSNLVTWVLPVMQPKERVTIQYVAEIISCNDLTNRFAGAQGCLGQTCQSGGPVVSRVEIPPAILLNTNQAVTPIETCYTRTVTVTVRNAGLLSVYSAAITEVLPVGLWYVTNTTEVSTDTVNWQPGPNPTIIGQSLHWGPGSGVPLDSWLSRLRPGETVYLRYNVYASCPFEGGQLRIQTGYRDTCGNPYLTEASYFLMPVRQSDLTLIKSGQNLSRTSPSPGMIYAEPGEPVVFTLTLTNASAAAPAHEVVVTDTLPNNVVFWGASPGYTGPAPGSLGGVITWAFDVITPATTVVLTITTVVSQPEGCTVADTYNIAEVAWGCPDGCRQGVRTDLVTLRTRPVYDTPIIRTDLPPATLHECGGLITVTLNNQGPPAYNVTLTDTLPSGYVYSGTVSASTPPSGTVNLGQTVVYTWGVLPTGPTVIVIAVRNSVGAGGCVFPSGPNVITMTYDDDVQDCYNTGTYSATATTNINVVGPNLVVDKSPATLTAQVGQRVTWTLRITNTGTGAAYNVVVTDGVDTTFTDTIATNGSDGSIPTVIHGPPAQIIWYPNPIPPGGVWTAQVSAVLSDTGVNRNVVTATASCDTGCLATSGSDIAYVTLMQQFDKGPTIQTGTIGSLVVFTFTAALPDIENIYEQLIFTDSLFTGLGYVGSVLTVTWDVDRNQGGPVTQVITIPTSNPGYLNPGDVTWHLGNMTGVVQVDGVITAVIQNITDITYDGARLTNWLAMTYWDDGQPYRYDDFAQVDVLEPLLHIGKSYMTPYGCGATLLQDNFNRAPASPPTGWTAVNGTWSNVNGVAQQTSDSTVDAILYRSASAAPSNDYSYSAMVWSGDATASYGIVFRYVDANNYYRLVLRLNDGGVTNLSLIEAGGTGPLNLTRVFAPTTNRWYHLEVQVEGNRIRGYVDGVLYFDVTDTTPRTGANVGFYANNCAANACRFDDVLATRFNQTACYVGANDLVTYTLTVSNQAPIPAYDLVITDVLPASMSLVTYTMQSDDPTAQVVAQPSPIPGATGILTWGINHLTPTVPYTWGQHTAITLNVVLQVSDGITANTVLSDQASLAYSSQPGSGPVGVERGYSGGSHSAAVQTANGGIAKTVTFSPPPTATLGTLVTYTLIIPAQPISVTLYNVIVTDTIDSRMRIEAVTTGGGTGPSSGWSGQVVTAAFASIPHDTQAYITITARISHEWPSPAGDANAGDVLTDVAQMSHATAPVTTSNQVSTTVGEPNLLLRKSAESSTGSLNDLDGTALLTYTIRLTNTGTSPAYSVHITDNIPAGISVTALYGGDSRSGPVVGPGVLTWTVDVISNVAPANVVVLTYTARVSGALVNAWLTNTVDILYHSLTETIPGVRPYTNTDQLPVETAQPALDKSTEPFIMEVGDVVTYRVVFTIPAGTVWGGNTLVDVLSPGLWYITDSETLAWTPSTVNVAITSRVSNTTEQPGSQVIRWYFAPITSEQDIPTVVTLTFRAQAVGLRIDTLQPVWLTQTVQFQPGNYVQLEFPWPNVVTDVVTNILIQPYLEIAKESTPPPGSYVGAGDRITYTLILTNSGYGLAYDIVVSDVLPAELFYVTSTVASTAPPYITFLSEPPVGATGVLTWRVNELWGREWAPQYEPKVATITVIAQVTDTVGANLTFTNTAAIPYYDSQPGDGPGPYTPDEREYTDGSDTVSHHTVDAAIAKTVVPPTATLGDVVTYVVVVPATPITATLYNVTVTDSLDPRLQLHTVTDGPDGSVAIAGNGFTVTYPSIPAGGQRFITVTAVLSDPLGADAGDVITNLAVLQHQNGGPTPSNPVTVTVEEPHVTLDKSVQVPRDPLGAGDIVTYTLALSNTGTWPAYDLVITDSLPVGLNFVATVSFTVTDPATATLGGNYPAWTVSQLNVGGFVLITFTAQVAPDIGAGLVLTNAAWGRTDSQPGPVPGEREYPIPTDTVPVNTGYPALDLEKSAEPSPVNAGGLLTYTLTVVNTGIVSATGVVVTDAVPANTTYLSCGPLPCGESGGVVSWTLGTLDIGIPRVLTMLVRVDSPLPDGTVLTNTAWVTSTEGLTDTDEVTTPVTSAPVLNLAKFSTDADGAPLRPGDRLTYTLVVSNTGNETASNVTISDTVPAHTTYIPGSIAGGDSRSDAALPTLVWVINSLPPNVPVYLTYAVTLNLPLTDGLQIVNTASVTCTEVPTPTTDTVTDTVIASHRLDVEKSAEPAVAQAGSLLTYTLAYTIAGDEPVYGVVVSDTTPANTTFWAAIPPAASDPGVGNSGPVVWNLGDFLPPESGITQATGVLTLVVLVDSPLVSGTLIYNAVAITDTSGLTNTDDVTTPVESRHSLSITKSADPAVVQAGDLLTYTLAWTVTGNEPALGVTISDTVPANTTYQACYGGLSCGEAGGVVTWNLGDQYPPTSGVVTLVVLVNSPLVSGTVIYNAVAITDTSGLTDTDDVTTPVESRHSLSITKSADPAVLQAGGLLTYTLAWAVSGNEPAFGVTISDTVPANTTYQACYGGLSCGEAGGVVIWSLGDQYPPALGVVTLVVLVDSVVLSGTLIYNAVAITDTSGLTDTDDVTTPVQTRSDLAVAKTDDPDPVIVGTLLTYTLVVTNHGPSVARNVVVTDTLPPEVAFVSADPTPVSGPNPLVWNLGDMAVGETRRLTVTVRVLVTTTDVFTNAVVVGSDTPDDNPDNNQDEEPTTPLVPGLELTKDVAPGEAVRNMPFTYTIRITNTGQVTFDPLVLTDTLPADFHYVVGSGSPSDPDVIAEPLLVWNNLGPLAPGESITVSFAVTATPGITGTYWNVALAEGTTPGGVLTDTDDAPVAIVDPAVVVDKQLVSADLDDVQPNYVTFTIVITNVGVSTIDVLPLLDAYDTYYLSFVTAEPYPEEDADDGLLTWYDLTGLAPNGFGRDLAPGESFRITTVFRVVHDITTTVNTAVVTDVVDVYDNPANEDDDDEVVVDIPTAVELLYFRVGGVAGRSVHLEWATAVEIGTFGFNLYRAPVADFARATPVAFVPSEARGGGATYAYTDTVPADGLWWYWLAEVDVEGWETRYGPVSAAVGAAALPYRVYLPMVLR